MTTTTIRKFNPAACRLVAAAIDGAIEAKLEELGLRVEIGGGRYDENTYSPKITVTVDGFDPARAEFDEVAPIFGLEPSDFGRTFDYGGERYRLVGLKANRPKYPVIGERISATKNVAGGRYKLPQQAIAAVVAQREGEAAARAAVDHDPRKSGAV